MKYIIYELLPKDVYDLSPWYQYERTILKNDKELKDYLFKHRDNLKNIEIFNKSNKCEIKFEVTVK